MAGSASAQLNGSYTINSGTATGGTNYQTWTAFATDITTKGVNGKVTVTVQTDVTTSTQTVFGAISGASSTNTITIDGGSKILSYNGSYEVISFTGADYVTIKNLTIQHTSTSTLSSGIRFSSGSDYNTIDNCIIEFTAMTSTGGSSAYIYFSQSQGSPSSATSTSPGKYNTVSNCTMRTTGSNPAGPYFGIAVNGNTSTYSGTADNNSFLKNKIQNYYYYAVFNYYTNGNQFIDNDISRSNATSSSAISTNLYGIYSYYTYSTNRSTAYKNNNFHDLPYLNASSSSTTNYIAYFYGLYAFYNYGNTSNTSIPFLVEGNTFKNIMVYYYSYTFYMYYDYIVDLKSNTIDNLRCYSSGYSCYPFYVNYGSDYNITYNTVKNCKFGEAGTGYAYTFYLYYIYNTYRTRNLFDDNVIENNWSGYYFYATQFYYYSSWSINRNRIVKNNTASNQGYFYGLYIYYLYNVDVTSNIIADNVGYYGNYNVYTYNYNSGYTANFRQNTLVSSYSSYPYHWTYGWVVQETQSKLTFDGNITQISSNYYSYNAYLYNTNSSNITSCDYNSFYFPSMVNQQWCFRPVAIPITIIG